MGVWVGRVTVRPHGTRTKYVFEKCRCFPCTEANRVYMNELAARKRPIWRVRCVGGGVMWQVFHTRTKEIELSTHDATEAYELRDHMNATSHIEGEEVENTGVASPQTMARVRRHLLALRSEGIGLRQVSRLTGVSRNRLTETMNRKSYAADRPQERRLYHRTAERILGVPLCLEHAAPGAIVDGTDMWRRIDELLASGMRKAHIDAAIGNAGRALQIRSRVLASTAARIRQAHDDRFRRSPRMREVCLCPEWQTQERSA